MIDYLFDLSVDILRILLIIVVLGPIVGVVLYYGNRLTYSFLKNLWGALLKLCSGMRLEFFTALFTGGAGFACFVLAERSQSLAQAVVCVLLGIALMLLSYSVLKTNSEKDPVSTVCRVQPLPPKAASTNANQKPSEPCGDMIGAGLATVSIGGFGLVFIKMAWAAQSLAGTIGFGLFGCGLILLSFGILRDYSKNG